ncbi:MAG: hypothetical protein Q6M04_05200 [Thermostichus sp. BF3_bins_97]
MTAGWRRRQFRPLGTWPYEQDVARRYRSGEAVQFVRLPGVGHDARNESGVVTLGWIQDRFAGRAFGSGC